MRPATFEISTGRTYDAPQVLQCEYLGAEPADFLGYRASTYKVVDDSRYMCVKVVVKVHQKFDGLDTIKRDIQAAYDMGNYKECSRGH